MKAEHFDYNEMAELLWGKYANKRASLSLSCKSIELEPCVGDVCESVIEYLSSGDDDNVYGVITVDDDRVSVTPENFRYASGKITCRFNTNGLIEGSELQGNITLITNCGEYTIPYFVKLLPSYPDSSVGKIKNLFHFTNLARENWQEALRIFASDEFINILRDSDARARALYKKLSGTWDRSQGMEEFLCAINKKSHITYEASVRERGIDISILSEEELPVPIEIRKSGWGYTRIRVKAVGKFIRLEKENLTDADFLGNVCRMNVFLVKEGLTNGYGRGEITLEGPYADITIPVCVGKMQPMIKKRRREYMEKVLRFYRLYIKYVLGQTSKRDWLDETEELLNNLRLYGKENVVWDIMRIHLLLTKEKYTEARALLDRYYEGALIVEAGVDIGCYYLYLSSLAKRDVAYTREVTYRIKETLSKNPDHFYVAWLLMYLDEEYASNPVRCWQLLSEHYNMGCYSPILLLEAGELVREHPDLLMKYSAFAVDVLLFLAKNKALTPELSGQAVYLAEHMKQADYRMIRVLCECYEIFGDDSILKAICSLLIKGSYLDRDALVWYRMGIRREIWLTNLYEYYMMSVDLNGNEDILPAALRYFSYSCDLPFERTAFLYAFIIKNKSRYEDVYTASLPMIEKALLNWLAQGLINENMARIFMDQWNRKGDIRDKLTAYLDVLFAHRVDSGSSSIKRFYLVDERDKNEPEYSITGKSICVGIYTESARIVFEDYRGFRYVDPDGSKIVPVFSGRDVARVISERGNTDPSILSNNVLLALWGADTGGGTITANNFLNTLELYSRDVITHVFKGDLGSRLIQFLDGDEKKVHILTDLLYGLDGDWVPEQDRKDIAIIMIRLELYEMAVRWLEDYGWEMLPARWAFFLVNHMHRDPVLKESPVLMPLSLKAYKDKKYNENILRYLAKWYLSDLHTLTELWQRCMDYGINDIVLGERILLQMAFSGSFTDDADIILKEHILAGGKAPSAVEALRHLCHKHLVHDYELSDVFKRELIRRYWQREKLSVVERIVILKMLRDDPMAYENKEIIINDLLPEAMYEDEVAFGFFEDISGFLDFKSYDDGKVYLSFLTDNEADIEIHYMRYLEDGTGEYQVEAMNSPCPGIYTKMFPLFPGERMKYHLTRKDASGEDELIKDGVLVSPPSKAGDALSDPNRITGRYNAIEGIARAIEENNAELAERSIKVYYEKDMAAKRLFKLL